MATLLRNFDGCSGRAAYRVPGCHLRPGTDQLGDGRGDDPATKYVTGNFVPVVGKMFADATDTVISASLLVKNSIGLAGVIIILFLCAFPAIKILTLALIYNIAAAVMRPLETPDRHLPADDREDDAVCFTALAAVSMMFFLAITILLTAGNITVMMR